MKTWTVIDLNKFFQVKICFLACLPSSHQRWQRPVWDYEDWFDELHKSSASTVYLKMPQEAVRFMNGTYSSTVYWHSVFQKVAFIPSLSPHKDNIVTCFGWWLMMEGFFFLVSPISDRNSLLTGLNMHSSYLWSTWKIKNRRTADSWDILGTYIRTG